MIGGKTIKLLIDAGASRSYITNIIRLRNIKGLKNPFLVKSIHGADIVNQKTLVNVFNRTETFFILPNLSLFDVIIGFSFIKGIKGVIDTENDIIYFEGGREKLKYLELNAVNALVSDICIPKGVEEVFFQEN